MSNDWYFVRDGERVGPRSRDEVAALLSTGLLPSDALVWSSGMDEWRPAAEVAEFQHLPASFGSAPVVAQPGIHQPSGSGYGAPAAAEDAGPHPWRRWAARIIDFGLFCLFFGVFIEISAPGTLTAADDLVLNILMLALWVPVEAMVLSTFGTTPAKWLLGIRVANADGTQLGLGTALNRGLQVWIRGMALGIPILMLVAMGFAYNRLTQEGSTAWDQGLGLAVTYSEIGVVRWAVIGTLLTLLLLLAVLGSMAAAAGTL